MEGDPDVFRIHSTRRTLLALGLAVVVLYGCGGGGSTTGAITGVITDVDGRAVPGATVAVGSNGTTSLSNGTFTLGNVKDGFQTVVAATDIDGHRWSGQSDVDVVGGESNRSLNIVVSDERFHGVIAGTVIDPFGFGLEGAKVFVRGALGSTLAITDRNGNYEVRRLTPGVTYTVTASLAGFVNDTKSVSVAANQTTSASFALANGSAQGPIPGPTTLVAQAWTVADTVTRAESKEKGVYDWLKQLYRKKRGLPNGPQAKRIEVEPKGRLTPPGSVIEIDLFWDYQSEVDLFGYAIRRATGSGALAGSQPIAVLRDPLTSVFFDVDPELTPDVVYHYTVHRLDTIEFPNTGVIGPPSPEATANPLGPVQATNPSQGASIGGDPLFQWTSVNGAVAYQVYVWDRFPALLFDPSNPNEPAAVPPVWPADLSAPGPSLVDAPVTQVRYAGPALQSGRTYYWMVVAVDSKDQQNIGALSASRIMKFVAQ
jgi:hypothetical protein